MNNPKNLTISTLTNSIKEQDNNEYTDDDIYEPPSSPPPPHLIYIPANCRNAGINPWQQNTNPYRSLPEEKKKNYYNSTLLIIRRHIFLFAKKLIKILLSNNNLLLIMNVVNKLWKARANFIHPFMFITKNTAFIIKHDGYINLAKYTIHFIQDLFVQQQQKHQFISTSTVSKLNHSGNPLTTLMLILATASHLFVVSEKAISTWLSRTIKSMGGLDSVIIAISAIAFTKTIQKSEHIF